MPVAIVSSLLQEYKSLVFDHLQIAPTADPHPLQPKNIQHFVQTQNKNKMSNHFCQRK